MDVVVIGAGAIGGTLGAHMARAGHRVLLCDQDAEHVAAIRADGLRIEGPVEEFTVRVDAVTPDELPERIDHAIVAVKSLHTASAAGWHPTAGSSRCRTASPRTRSSTCSAPTAWSPAS
jgi:2-dehydropantoate 2-reductase